MKQPDKTLPIIGLSMQEIEDFYSRLQIHSEEAREELSSLASPGSSCERKFIWVNAGINVRGEEGHTNG